ncbi:DNA gyrase inhibitor YacG [Conservatibacter flavescens]|uniref:DNA gyrase inhibitor YacG n=1 Tax=Conservatibacter flavescens TaxID=28161 RepID=A0A2M8S088_9PAST|nr:DNA gyrase inhibitor YacG [Conservatibacter flavescens]PJG84526.1 DNA gyrase inhibitor YacG [Conservatibacter flavescens]
MSEIIEVPCPTCGKVVEWSEKSIFRPFCSKRCQLIDLGAWAAEENAIPSETADFAMEVSDENQDWVKH